MVENFEEGDFIWKKFLFGSIRKKLNWAFGFLFLLLIIMIIITYNLNQQISTDQTYIREVNVPLILMVEQITGYDAMLTAVVYDSLLDVEKGESDNVKGYNVKYNDIGSKLDSLIRIEAPSLINKSRRSVEDKNKVYGYLNELDRVNIELVNLEISAFSAMENGSIDEARGFVLTDQYDSYKKELVDLYAKWEAEEARIAEQYRERILANSENARIYNLYLGILFILVSIILAYFIVRSIARPINELTALSRELAKGNYKARSNIETGDEIEELGEVFNSAIEQLEKLDFERAQVDKAKTEFMSITSHELRSPMTPMKAQLQMVLGNYFGKLNEKQKESLRIVLNNTERLDKIIVDFLEISRIEAARLKFNFVRADLSKTIDSVVEEMKGFMPEKKIKIVTHVEKLPTIEVDPDRVSQVLRNLINNAIKFTPENGIIEVSGKMHSGMILFSVKDSGIGIADKDQRRLFEPFFQVDNMYQHKSGGTGLGLAICKGIVESQDGKIWLSSQQGRGTTFYFTVPLRPVREVKAIKLLFSEAEKSDEEIKFLFKKYIGPLGEKEFENLKNSRGISIKTIYDYLRFLVSKGILKNDDVEEFKNSVLLVFSKGEKVGKKEFLQESKNFGESFEVKK
jgi:signal transduction histidine kinase